MRIANFLILAFFLTQATDARSEVPNHLEPQFSQAVLAFNGRNHDYALKLLDELLKLSPQTTEFLELRALALRTTDQTQRSAEAYANLIRAKKKENATLKQVAPYFFELGVLQFRAKKFPEARGHFATSIRGDFNVGAAHYFLGTMLLEEKQWEQADVEFDQVLSSEAKDMWPLAHYARAQIASALQDMNLATWHFLEARRISEEYLRKSDLSVESRKTILKIYNAAQTALAPLAHSQWFGNLALTMGYDTNVLLVPTSSVASSATGLSSVKGIFQAGIGMMTSPLSTWQLVPNYRFSFSYHLNRDTSSADFITNTLSLYLNHKPLSQTAFGFKLEGNLFFQNVSGVYARYLTGGAAGPYLRRSLSRDSQLTFECILPYQSFADASRTGLSVLPKISFTRDAARDHWNPTATLSGIIDRATSAEYRSVTLGLSLGNRFYINQKFNAALTASYSYGYYAERTPEIRLDHTVGGELVLQYALSGRATLLGSASYTLNQSNLASTYTYNRFLGLVGLNYSLF